MAALEGPFAAACVLLLIAGAYKVARPAPTTGALRGLGWPSHRAVVRTLGLGEIALGAAAVATSARVLAALVAVAYASFAVFVVAALQSRAPIQSCGCFGEVTTPPSVVHVVTNLAFLGVASAVAIGGLPSLSDVVSDQPGSGIPFVVLVAVLVYLLYVLLTELPNALSAPGVA